MPSWPTFRVPKFETEFVALVIEGLRQPLLQCGPCPQHISHLLDGLRLNRAVIVADTRARVAAIGPHQNIACSPVNQFHHVRRTGFRSFQLIVVADRIHHSRPNTISDITKVRCCDTRLFSLPIDLTRHRLNELRVGKIKKHQRGNNRIVIGAVTEATASIGTGVCPCD